jgi:hypothetical protein
MSSKDCVRGRTWGATSTGITVTGGCRAEFVIGNAYDSRYQTYNGVYTTDRYGRRIYDDRYTRTGYGNSGETFHCQGTGHGRTYCGQRGQHYFLTYRSPSCIVDRTWGNDAYGTWVSGTCNADFRNEPIAEDYNRGYNDEYYDTRSYDPYGTSPGTYTAPMGSEVIYCQSSGSGRTYCGDRNRSYTLRHSSDAYCVLGETYGRDTYGTWVAGNCNLTLEPGDYDRY